MEHVAADRPAALSSVLRKLEYLFPLVISVMTPERLVKFKLRRFMSEQGERVCTSELRAAAEAS